MRLLCFLALMLVPAAGLTGLVAQQPATPAPLRSTVDIAPAPSERFPAEWYDSENSYTYTTAPVVGAPFTGQSVMTTKVQGHPPFEIHMRTMRDGAGRTRTEEYVGQGSDPGQSGPRQIEVNDVVRHCSFRWVEPAHDASAQQASVRCLSRTLNWNEDGTAAKMTRQALEVVNVFPGVSDQIEPLGEKTIAGMRALGVRQTRINTKPNGTTSGDVVEIWWSPELKEFLSIGPVGDTAAVPAIELHDIRLGEPDRALFYPPAGWRIVPQHHQP